MNSRPEPWLRGPVAGIVWVLQPIAHAFIMAREDVAAAVGGLTPDEVWMQPGGIAPIGFHAAHLAGSTDRLLTYARGDALSDAQREVLQRERTFANARPGQYEMHDIEQRSFTDLSDDPTYRRLEEPRHSS